MSTSEGASGVPRIESILRSAPDAIVTIDEAGRILEFNPAAERIFGRLRAATLGRPMVELLIPPRLREEHRAGMKVFRETGAGPILGKRLETAALRADGTEFPVELTVSVDASSVPPRFTAFIRDITDRREAERALRESEARNRTLVEHAPEAIVVFDAGLGRFVDCNDNALRLFGYSREELLRRGPGDVSPPPPSGDDQAAEIREKVGRALEGEILVFEWTHCNSRGESFPCEVRLVRLPGDRPIVRGSVADITQRKRADSALRESEERYRSLIASMAEGIVLQDASGVILTCNPAAERMLGLTRDQMMGRSSLDPRWHSVHEDGSPFPGETHPSMITLRTGKPCKDVIMGVHTSDGRLTWISINAEPLFSPGRPDPVGVVCSFSDITDRKHAEAERSRLEEQLRHSQKMESVGRLAGGIAHDFNNLLTPILGYAEIALGGIQPSDPLREPLRQILVAANHAKDLTRQLLAFGRKQLLEMKVLDLNRVVNELDGMLRRVIGEDVHLETRLAPSLGLVRADPSQITQIVLNLAVNARDAMPRGGTLVLSTAPAEVTVEDARTHLEGRPGRFVALDVTDSGTGMTPEILSRIFEPFFTTKDRSKGTGLGLATVYGIVKQHGGTIQVTSEPGRGSTFRVCFPRVDDAVEAAVRAEPPRGPAGRGETVLLVEDDSMVRELTRTVLSARGFTVIVAGDGPAAVRAAETWKGTIHLLLTDVIMPGMNGKELHRRLAESMPDLRVLYMSGYTDDVIAEHGVLEAGVHFLPKPFGLDVLIGKIRTVLDAPR